MTEDYNDKIAAFCRELLDNSLSRRTERCHNLNVTGSTTHGNNHLLQVVGICNKSLTVKSETR